MFKHVFLFDPVAKRKYPLVKDTEGDFQAQPLAVKGDGGRFIHDWRKTTLVSLTFQAPPDTVQRADLLLPQFLPFEGVTIEGLGGAAAGGIAAAGKTLGLEGALKELNAEVTATEIKIDLAADVLFDFDKAEIKKEAEPSLQNLATVLKANPGATVTHRRAHRRARRGRLQPDALRSSAPRASSSGSSRMHKRTARTSRRAAGARRSRSRTTRSPTARTIPKGARRTGASRSSCARAREGRRMRIPEWMAHAIRNPALSLALTLVGLALPWPLPFAAAQSNLFNLDGIWELEDRGVLAQDKLARVEISQTGQSVRGRFISGAACFDKKVRPYAIDGVLSVSAATPDRLSLSGATMWACSGTPSLVEECGDRISSMYQTTVSNVSLSHDLITGDRARQEVLNCVGRPSSETTRFTLRRIPPCEDAERTVTRLRKLYKRL